MPSSSTQEPGTPGTQDSNLRKRHRGMSLRSQMFTKQLLSTAKRAQEPPEGPEPHTEDESSPIELQTYTDSPASRTTDNLTIDSSSVEVLKPVYQKPGFFLSLKNKLQGISSIPPSRNGRHIPLGGSTELIDERTGLPYVNNSITSSRYTLVTFLPRQLYAQFLKLANTYFLVVAILQMIPTWSTTGQYTTIIPLLIFVSISMGREAWDDFRRHKLDRRENLRLCRVLGTTAMTYWKDVKVGDVVQLGEDEWVPADIVLLSAELYSDLEPQAYIETMALDGETNLKARLPPRALAQMQHVTMLRGEITAEDPNIDLYNFEGSFIISQGDGIENTEPGARTALGNENTDLCITLKGLESYEYAQHALGSFDVQYTQESYEGSKSSLGMEDTGSSALSHALGPDNIIYRGSIIRNTRSCTGIVVFTGEETKIRMNSIKNPRVKAPKLQKAINRIVLFMVCVVVCLLAFFTMAQRLDYTRNRATTWYLYNEDVGVAAILMGYIIMFNTLIPLSLYVTTEIIKVMQVLLMCWDLDMYHYESNTPAESKTATILEELGQVSYIFSDKTGTLTDNIMLFKKFSVGGRSWEHNSSDPFAPSDTDPFTAPSDSRELIRHLQTHPESLFSQKATLFLLSLALCNTCLPKPGLEGVSYLASSPDELALVMAAKEMGFVVFERQHTQLVIKTYPHGPSAAPVLDRYEVMDVIDFTSTRKRMSVVVKFPDGRLCLVCKGADNVILERLKVHEMAARISQTMLETTTARKNAEAEAVLRKMASQEPRTSVASLRQSFSLARHSTVRVSIDSPVVQDEELAEIIQESRRSLHIQQAQKYHLAEESYIPPDNLVANEEYVIEKTLEHVEEFSTEGLRTLLYAYRWLDESEYATWATKYAAAKTVISGRAAQVAAVGSVLERDMLLVGASAIEDKLQHGVAAAIEKLRRAGIKMWMLTGDKRETAINIGYACKLIRDYSTVVVLDIAAGKDELLQRISATDLAIGGMAHCVVVIDGTTLMELERDCPAMSLLVELCCKTDAAVVCRASPAQKAHMVSAVRTLKPESVTLAVGDGANDIAMIQSADIGVGITGKEGLQAARSADYAVAQFRFLLKLLLVHGRYNYVRTSKFVLLTFYKELLFYLSQGVYQRYTMYTGSSMYESWSLSMFNTLFTSLCVICVGMFEKDLKPATLLAVPELYKTGRLSEIFNLRAFVMWMLVAASQSLLLTFVSYEIWGFGALRDNSTFPTGVLTFTTLVIVINVKCQLLEMHNRTVYAFGSLIIAIGGWFLWNLIIAGLYKTKESPIFYVAYGLIEEFGRDYTWWAALLVLVVVSVLVDVLLKAAKFAVSPTRVEIFQVLEKDYESRKFFEENAFEEMKQGWTWPQDQPLSGKLHARIFGKKMLVVGEDAYSRKRAGTLELPPLSQLGHDSDDYNVLPSGKAFRIRSDSTLGVMRKKLRFKGEVEEVENVDAIIEQRFQNLQLEEEAIRGV
ncbi:hypothetical protein BABINDRAFT_166381 [Babjeviella inositovora NRRL Y-12698]|uniref:Phospholipid-transporting ATPase n=1 Tax=Babjeviella inositovora NRRL Y-12698 TaxID=984486 RepID=A0A1E3QT02_9ASCO|nr:uncharacterized protein BABINDRAFT_166381 [Babjeviella inositovora NRRL Y-12698]ODQ80800.1 hypothetical protein BABINDRAFT_166381 [Babjeviella inositovora NRRL Y-12698]